MAHANTNQAGNTTVEHVRGVMDRAYPPALAESWDAVGLICGDPETQVNRIIVALECTDAVVAEAIESNADMIVVHHPLLMRGVASVAADTPKGRLIHQLIKHDIALFAAHTNADSARPGVNDKLAELLGVTPGAALAPQPVPPLDSWTVKVPEEAADAVKDAVFAAGGGQIGDYSHCAFSVQGIGQFKPESGANPHIGAVGDVEYVSELQLEFVAPQKLRTKIHQALVAAHPYEEPAFDIVESQATGFDETQQVGIGRVGELDTPMPFKEFVQRVADRLPKTEWGVRGAGDAEQLIETVAVASGAGDSFLDTAIKLGVDAFVTSDLRHHPVDETLRVAKHGLCIVDTAHWASEYPWCFQAAELLAKELGLADDAIWVSEVRSDP